MPDYTKLSDLVGEEFTVSSVGTPVFKMWDPKEGKMLMSRSFEKGYRKLYPVITEKGQMDIGMGQLGTMLEAVSSDGKADLTDKTFLLKSNGKTGIDIRYFFNPVVKESEQINQDVPEEWR